MRLGLTRREAVSELRLGFSIAGRGRRLVGNTVLGTVLIYQFVSVQIISEWHSM